MTLSNRRGDYKTMKIEPTQAERRARVLVTQLEEVERKLEKAEKQLAEINTPEIQDFIRAVQLEAKHQRLRWGSEHDSGKTDADWFWLVGYLAGKAIHKPEKALHHIITTAAACLNWHAAKIGVSTAMRPGIEEPKGEAVAELEGDKNEEK